MKDRARGLARNGQKMFWIRALQNVKLLNIVLSLFYLAREVSLSQILFLNLIWALTVLLTEIPSSYLADRWGRKKTLIISCIFLIIQWAIFIFAEGFWFIAIGMICYGLSFAAFSGTDEALVYDSEHELSHTSNKLSQLGKYQSAHHVMKIGAPILGAFLARDLTDAQFQLLIGVDLFACLVALGIACTLVEPKHTMDLAYKQQGVLKDAMNLVRNNPRLYCLVLNKEFVFFSSFIVWSLFQVYFLQKGMPLIALGIGWGTYHVIAFFQKRSANHFLGRFTLATRINLLNLGMLVFSTAFFFADMLPTPVFLLFSLFLASQFMESARWPYFSSLFHTASFSYNRATTLSTLSLLHNAIEIPIMLLGSFMLRYDMTYLIGFSVILAAMSVFIFRVPKTI